MVIQSWGGTKASKEPWLRTRNDFPLCNLVSLLYQFHDLVGLLYQFHDLVGVPLGGREGKETVLVGSSSVWEALGEERAFHGLVLLSISIPFEPEPW